MTDAINETAAAAEPLRQRRLRRTEAVSLKLRAPREGVTAAAAFLIFLPLLFLLQLGALGAVLGFAMGAVFAALNVREMPRLFGARAFLLAAPLFILASAIWSEDPGASLRYGVQVLVTVLLGLILSLSPKRREVLAGVFLAFAVYIAVSVVFGRFVGMGVGDMQAFSGLNKGKNFVGEIASTGLLTSVAVLAICLRDRRLVWALAVVGAIGLEFYVTLLTRSAGAIIALTVGLSVFGVLMIAARLPRAWRGVSLGGLALGGVLALTVFRSLVHSLQNTVLGVFDKDPTLTGRTYLWYRAHQMIDEKPWFGHGWAAFWRQGNIDAEGLWRFAGIDDRSGFNFHNTLIELEMQLGIVGTAIVLLVILVGISLLFRRYLANPRVVHCYWLALIAFEMTRTPYESVGPAPFYFSTVLVFAGLASAFSTSAERGRSAADAALAPQWRLRRARLAAPAT